MDRSDVVTLIAAEIAVISKLLEIKSVIEAYHRKCNIARTTAASVSAAGVVSTIAGVMLAPATGGVSLVLTAGGLVAGIGGGATSIGTDVVSHFRYKRYAKELEAVLRQRLGAYHVIGSKVEQCLAQGQGQVMDQGQSSSASARVGHPTLPAGQGQSSSASASIISSTKCQNAPSSKALCLTGLIAASNSVDSATKIYDTSKILTFLYINREIYSISNLSASLLAQNQLSGLVIGTIRQSLNKGLLKLGARVGLNGLKVGARTLLIGLGVVGIAWDAFSLVKAWSGQPEMWREVQALILAIQSKIDQLEMFIARE